MSLSHEMKNCITFARSGNGKLYRQPGGFWKKEEFEPYGISYGTPTIEALVKRGLAEYTEWKDGRRGRFPVVVEIKENICSKA